MAGENGGWSKRDRNELLRLRQLVTQPKDTFRDGTNKIFKKSNLNIPAKKCDIKTQNKFPTIPYPFSVSYRGCLFFFYKISKHSLVFAGVQCSHSCQQIRCYFVSSIVPLAFMSNFLLFLWNWYRLYSGCWHPTYVQKLILSLTCLWMKFGG